MPDCDGEALSAAVEVADLLVPNGMEAARLVGRAVEGPADAAAAARELVARGPERVVITLGEQGAVSARATGVWWARVEAPPDVTRSIAGGSAVGAGDAFLAGLLLAEGRATGDPAAGLAAGVAAGTAVLLSRGDALVRAEDARALREHVRVERLAE